MHVHDLIQVERDLGYRYETDSNAVEHYQWICPPCRRTTVALAQGRLRAGDESRVRTTPAPMPVYANREIGEGPLGEEDRRNFHP
jgi:hypothetical protein